MGRKLTPRKVLNYIVFVVVAMMAYKVFFQSEKKRDFDSPEYYPKNERSKGEFNEDNEIHRSKFRGRNHESREKAKVIVDPLEEDGHVLKTKHGKDDNVQYKLNKQTKNDKDEDKINKQTKKEDSKMAADDSGTESKHRKHEINVKDENQYKNKFHKKNPEVGKTKLSKNASKDDVIKDTDKASLGDDDVLRIERLKKLHKGNVDFEMEEEDVQVMKEKNERRKAFFKALEEIHEDYNDEAEDEHFHERDDDLAIATAAWTDNFLGALQLVESVQRYLPRAEIGLFDLGLSDDQRKMLQTLCRVKVHRTLLVHMPDHVKDLSRNLWRPFVLQMALGTYGHVIYISPERKLKSIEDFKGFVAQSRIGGVSIVGRRRDYSTFVVTHPDMYHYFSTDLKQLQRTKHVEISMIILHNTAPVRMKFMRWLYLCSMEEWCIAPPGSHTRCDHRQHANSRLWANCHRYDESAINILLAGWHKYDTKHYVRRDTITSHYDGRDVTNKLQYCDTRRQQGDL